MPMPIPTLDSILRDLPMKEPIDASSLENLEERIFENVKDGLDTILIDFVWVNDHERPTHLDIARTSEGEKHNFKGIDIDYPGRKDPARKSVISWCFANKRPIWITDEKGLSANRTYRDSWGGSDGDEVVIPEGTIWQYTRKPNKTEICYPIRIHGQTYGVLNI